MSSTTAGMSYSYTLPRTYQSTTTNAAPCYKTLGEYNPCGNATIIAPTPVATIPAIFINQKPHSMPSLKPSRADQVIYGYGSKPDNNNLAGCGNCSPYKSISQPGFTVGGLSNEPYYRLGFNDITNNNTTNNFNNSNINKFQTKPTGNNYFQ